MDVKRFSLRVAFMVSVFFLVLALVFSTFDTYAWYSNLWIGERQLVFTAGVGEDPLFYAWIYDVTNEESGETLLKTGIWRNIAQNGTGDGRDCQIAAVQERGVADSEKYLFTSLHLGTVDNLISLSNDNYMYLRFDVNDVARQGRKLRIGYSLSSDGVHFYDLEGADQTASLTAQTLTEFVGLLNVEYALSTEKYDPTVSTAQADSLAGLFSAQNAMGFGKLTNGAALTDLFQEDRAEGYTLYLRFYPDLQGCFDVTEFLGAYMPCEILYDLTLDLEYYEIHV